MLLSVVHYAHILAGLIWGGGTIVLALALYPHLSRLPAIDAKALWDPLATRIGPLMGGAAGVTMLLGLVRAWLGGKIVSFGGLLSPYGLIVILSLILAIAEGALGEGSRKRLTAMMDDGATYAREAPGELRRSAIVSVTLIGTLVLLMVVMGLGWV